MGETDSHLFRRRSLKKSTPRGFFVVSFHIAKKNQRPTVSSDEN